MNLQNARCNDKDFITFLLISTKTANVTGEVSTMHSSRVRGGKVPFILKLRTRLR